MKNPKDYQNTNLLNHDLHDRIQYFYILIGIICTYILAISYLSIIRYESFSASVYDMGIMIQTIWNTSHGWTLQESINMGFPMIRFWMAHWEFIYLFIAAIYKIIQTPYTLIFIQTIFVAIGALPIYWIVMEKFGHERMALIFSVSYLLYPAIQNANLCDIHGVTLGASPLIFAFYYLYNKKIGRYVVFALIAVICREDVALILTMMGLYAFVFMKERKIGLITICLSALWFLIWLKRMTIRNLLGLPPIEIMAGADGHYDHLTNALSGPASNLIKYPIYLLGFLAKKFNIYYFLYLFGPVLFLSFFSPLTLAIASPILALNLLSSYYYTHDVEHYYSAIIAPFIYISAVFGMKNVFALFKNDPSHVQKKMLLVGYGVLISSTIFFFIKSNALDAKDWRITSHHRIIKKTIAMIPEQASVSAEQRLAAHAAERHEIYVFNDNIDKVDYILYDFYAPTINLMTRSSFEMPPKWPENEVINDVLINKDFGITHYEDGVILLNRGADYQTGLEKLAISSGEDIVNTVETEIQNGIFLKGYNTHQQLKYYVAKEKWGGITWHTAVHFTCFWQRMAGGDTLTTFSFTLKSEHGRLSNMHQPIFGIYPMSAWPEAKIIRDEVYWELPEQSIPGTYNLYVNSGVETEKNEIYLFDVVVN
jgi:uncharacterized membrane protein